MFQTEEYRDAPANGVVIESVKYIVPRVEDNLVFGKKDKAGVFMVKTNQGIISISLSTIIYTIFESSCFYVDLLSILTVFCVSRKKKKLQPVGVEPLPFIKAKALTITPEF